MDIKRSIKFFMFFHDLSQQGLARASGCSETNIHRWIHGKSEPSLYMLERLAHCCGVSVSNFIAQGETEPEEIANISRPVLTIRND